MDNIVKEALLLDFYGSLLTEKQFTAMDLYYNHDYSLAEISEHLSISRQGVHDFIKKSRKTLDTIDSKLKLIEKYIKQKDMAQELLRTTLSINKSGFTPKQSFAIDNIIRKAELLLNSIQEN